MSPPPLDPHEPDAHARASDPDGEALDREIEGERREAREARRRLWLYVPPMVALGLATVALGLSRPRSVLGARVIAGPLAPTASSVGVRVVLLRETPGDDSVRVAPGLDVRVLDHAAATTNDDGVAELAWPGRPTGKLTVEARASSDPRARWTAVATIDPQRMGPADPSHGVRAEHRTSGASSGPLRIEVAPENGALSPPIAGAFWVRVRRDGAALAGAKIEGTIESGASGPLAAVTTGATGLARIAIAPTAPPVVVELAITDANGNDRSSWRGVLGAVLGVPTPVGNGLLLGDASEIVLAAPSGRRDAYWDLWHDGVRIAGGRAQFDGGFAHIPLPSGARGLFEIETSLGADPGVPSDLAHAGSFALVRAPDAMDAWSEIAASPRTPGQMTDTGGTPEGYAAAVAFTLARAPVALPPRKVIDNGLPAALLRERGRMRMVRRAAAAGIAGAGLLEVALLLALGLLRRNTAIDEAIADLGESNGLDRAAAAATHPDDAAAGARRTVALVVAALGIVSLVFAAVALMAWGMP